MGTGTAPDLYKAFPDTAVRGALYVEVAVTVTQEHIALTHVHTPQARCWRAACVPASGASQHKELKDMHSYNSKAFGRGSLGFLRELILLAFDTF